MAEDYPHLKTAAGQAIRYIQRTWQECVMGAITVPGVKALKINLGLRKLYSESIVLDSLVYSPTGGGINRRAYTAIQAATDLETGKGPWDMKPGLLNGPKAKIDKKGNRYVTVPLRHGVPRSANNATFSPMPTDVYALAKALKPSITPRDTQGLPTGKTQWGGRTVGTEINHPKGANPTTGALHENGIYEGMVKIQKTYRAATQSKYLTFRRVSSNSKPGSWVHPGYEAYHVARGVAQFCQPTVNQIIATAAQQELVDNLTPIVGISVTSGA